MFIVVYESTDDPVICPYSWDDDCEGALTGHWKDSPVAYFADRQAARKAIEISTAWNKLLKAQGGPANDDFIDPKFRRNIRILKLQAKDGGAFPGVAS